jgi:hypothetical protein
MPSRDIKRHKCPRTTCHECACTVLSVMTTVPKAAAEMVQRPYGAKWSLYKAYPRYVRGDFFFGTLIYIHTYTKQSIGKNKIPSNFSRLMGNTRINVREKKVLIGRR